MPLPTSQRSSRRRGSVLILVVAVLVLLALMGTAYIATSRADRTASATSESTASVDALAKGVVDTLKTQLVNDRIDASNPAVGATLRNTATGYFAYNNAASTLRTDGLLTLSARVPVATGTTSPGNRPRWPFISSPLDASPTNPGSFANPAPNAAVTGVSYTNRSTTLNVFAWGRNEGERRGSDANLIASVTLAADGRTYPAFFTTTAGLTGYAIAADADGDGIADSGLSPLGTLPNADFSGITFFYGIRLIDNNSAFNANTAWTTGSDFTVAGAPGAVRNNRLFPAAIGLKESTTPIGFGQFTKLDPFDDEPNGFDLSAYRAGRFGYTDSLANRARPVVDVDSSSGRSNLTVRRTDFQFNTQQELLYFQLARRLDFPGVHGGPTGTSTFARFTPFTLAEQAQLAHGFVLAPKDVADTVYAAALEKRPPIEQLLGGSLYRIAGYPSTPGLTLRIPTLAYPASQIGVRRANPVASEWFSENFNYEVAGTGPDPLTVLNLRPLLVTQNPVAQSTTFKPLPLKAVLPPDSTYDVMHPYVPRWILGQRYNRGDIVFQATNATNGRFYRSDFDGLTNSSADPANVSNRVPPGAAATALRPWSIYDGPLVATKVDINTAPFGDLWRAFYLTFTSDFTIPTDTSGPFSSNGTVSHFEVPQLGNGTTNDVLTDSLEELYRGMGFSGGVATPTLARPNTASPAQNTYHPQRALRANVKDFVNTAGPNGHFTLPPAEMAKLRAAQAAANAEYLRTANQIFSGAVPHSLTVRKIALRSSRATSADPDVAATVYSVGHFPYITEVYANNDGVSGGGANPGGYVAIELFNPYPFDISLDDWELHILPRTSGAAIPVTGRATTLLLTFGSDDIRALIPANGYLLLENYSSGADAAGTQPATIAPSPATVRPAGSGLPVTGDFRKVLTDIPVPPNALNRAYVPGLETLFGTNRGELVLLRPVNAFIIGNVQTAAPVTPRDPAQYAPVDSFDFTGFAGVIGVAAPSPVTLTNYHYARRTDEWRFVYPGRYDGRTTSPLRQQGVIAQDWDPALSPGTEPIPGATLGGPSNPNANGTATYNTTFPIQIVNIGQGGFRAAVTDNSTNANSYPFGGFPRDLDILQVPFISPVRLRPISSGGPPDNVFELVSLTQDAAFAEDTDTHDNFEENVGRFTPIATPALAAAPADFSIIDDFSPQTFRHRYGFANRLLDHLTVRSSTRLNTPAVGPTGGTGQFSVANYPDSVTNDMRVQPVAAKPAAFTTPNAIITPDAGVQGLININTAPLPVLAAVPWVRSTAPAADGADRADNVRIAQAIIAHRDANGPFRSIFQLNTVAGFRTLNPADQTLLTGMTTTPRGVEPGAAIGTVSAFTTAADRSNDNGDFSPLADGTFPGNLNATPAADSNFPGTLGGTGAIASTFPLANPVGDYESQFLNLIAVSNLITTRSDTFTAYIVIEGWRNAGTSSATRVIQRRHAYILDRTGVAPGVPPQLLNMDLAAANDPTLHPVVTPFNASGPINRPVNTSVRATEIPVPSGP